MLTIPSPWTPHGPAGERPAERAFIVPRDLPGPSGGTAYNRRIHQWWDREGLGVRQESIPGAWPHPDRAALQALSESLGRCRQVLVDGIIASAAPEQLAHAHQAGVQTAVLMHLPLPAETGLTPAQHNAAEASERRALQHAGLVVCTSRWAQRDLVSRYGMLPTAVVTPGADTAALARGSRPPRLVFLGALSPRKNPLLLLRALEPLSHLEWTLTIAGPDGPDPDYVHAVRLAAQQHPGRVDLTGPLTGSRLDRLWDSADLLMLPSVAETYGMVITEAVARGVPAIVGAGTGAEEALAAGQEPRGPTEPVALPGCALDPTDPAEWTQVLDQWLTHDDLRTRWRAASLGHRDRLPTWSQAAKHLQTALQW